MLTSSKVVFKDYNPKENLLFPPNLSELIDEKHPVRIISDIIDGLDIKSLIKTYKPGGTSENAFESFDLWLFNQYLFKPQTGTSLERKHPFHVAFRDEPSRP